MVRTLLWIFISLTSISFCQSNEKYVDWIKRKCEKQLKVRLGEINFDDHVVQNVQGSKFICETDSEYPWNSETPSCKIISLQVQYEIVVKEEVLFSITFLSDSAGNIDCPNNSDWRYDLEGYKFLLDENFPINFENACEIIRGKGYDPLEYKPILVRAYPEKEGLESYEWHATKNLGNETIKVLYVDASTGEFSETSIQLE